MPRRPPLPCSWPGCPELTTTGRCPRHRRSRQRSQAGAFDPYHGNWPTIRRRFLQANRTCIDCGTPSTDADHVPPRRILLATGEPNPDHDTWLQARCHPCHTRATTLRDMPLLRRLAAGEDPRHLAELALAWRPATAR